MTDATMDARATQTRRYATAAIALHWIIAVLILTQFGMAIYMGSLPDDGPAQNAIEAGVHVPLGLTILMLSLARLAVRIANPPPPLNPRLSRWEKGLAAFSHVVFYGLILALPLTGWAMKSLIPRPISYFGLFNWPHLPGLAGIPREQGGPLYENIEHVHAGLLIMVFLLLLILHVAAAIKHQFDGKPVLWRMLPFMKPPAV